MWTNASLTLISVLLEAKRVNLSYDWAGIRTFYESLSLYLKFYIFSNHRKAWFEWKHLFLFNFNVICRALSSFDLPSRRKKKRQVILKTRLVSFYKRSKHWLTFNFDPRACFCRLKCRWISFQKALTCSGIEVGKNLTWTIFQDRTYT